MAITQSTIKHDPAQQQRVVDHQHVRTRVDRGIHDLVGAVEREGHLGHGLGAVPANQADRVPGFRQLRRVGLLQAGDNLAHRQLRGIRGGLGVTRGGRHAGSRSLVA